MKPVSSVLQFVLSVVALGACGQGTVGACYVEYQTPVFEVRKAVNATTGGAISQVRLSNFTLTRNGAVLTHDIRSLLSGPYHGVTVATDGTNDLICEVSCALGTDGDHYSMTVSAPGYAPKQVDYDVKFSSKSGGSGGCPLILSGPTMADISLVPSA